MEKIEKSHIYGSNRQRNKRFRNIKRKKTLNKSVLIYKKGRFENKNGASGRDWTADTRIFSPVLYQLSYRGKYSIIKPKWRSGRDSNSRPPQWQCGILTNWTTGPFWLREKDLNQRPPGYEPGELPDCSIPRYISGGERGIWTPARLASPVGFQDRSLQPLGYFSML